MARKEFLNYVWKYCIEPQLGYSFSLNHTLPYSIVAVQEMNLATRFHPLYWQCACLCVNAGNYAGELGDEEEETEVADQETETEEEQEEVKKEKRVAPNYGKIAKAISDAQLSGVKIELPDINESQVDFIPDIKNNSILYSLQAINVVGSDLLDRILSNRPFTSVYDFIEKVQPSQSQMIGLIKAGCFDKLANEPRTRIMSRYLRELAEEEFPLKDKLTSVQLKKALELGLKLDEYSEEIRMFKFKKYIDKNQLDKNTNRYILSSDSCIKFFNMFIRDKLNISKDEYGDLPNNEIFMKESTFKKVYNNAMNKLMDYLNSLEGRKAYQNLLQEDFIDGLREKYCEGNMARWEFDTTCCYFTQHELKGINELEYNIHNFKTLPENPEGKNLCAIAGTVVNTNNTRHIVSILTNYGVVDAKFYTNTYTNFNQKISTVDPNTKKKIVIEDSFFKRGNKIIVFGQRRENMFVAKNDYSSGFNRCAGLIDQINLDGTLTIHYTRKRR